jgi:hypothetical protein
MRPLDNPDRDFRADHDSESEAQSLRDLLQHSEVADVLDRAVRERVGRLIARAVFHPPKTGW